MTILGKRLILVFGSITMVLAATYFLVGKIIQENYYDTITKINARNGVKVSVISYNRGLFHSKAKLILSPSNANDMPETKSQALSIHQTITHGPIVAANTLRGFSIKAIACQIHTSLDEKLQLPLGFTTLVDFSKQATTWVQLKAVNNSASEGLSFSWDAANGEIFHDLNFINYHGVMVIPSITITNANSEFKLEDLNYKLDTTKSENSYSNSNVFRARLLSLSKEQQLKLAFNDTTLRIELTKNIKQQLGINIIANIQDSQILEKKFSQDNLHLQIANIDPTKLPSLPDINDLSPKAILDFVQNLTVHNNAKLSLELPRNFTESLLTYISFEMYRSSLIGKFDKRDDSVVFADITNSINNLVQGAIKQRLFLENGEFYALNFDYKGNNS